MKGKRYASSDLTGEGCCSHCAPDVSPKNRKAIRPFDRTYLCNNDRPFVELPDSLETPASETWRAGQLERHPTANGCFYAQVGKPYTIAASVSLTERDTGSRANTEMSIGMPRAGVRMHETRDKLRNNHY